MTYIHILMWIDNSYRGVWDVCNAIQILIYYVLQLCSAREASLKAIFFAKVSPISEKQEFKGRQWSEGVMQEMFGGIIKELCTGQS